MRFVPRVIIPVLMFMLLIGYQNFSSVKTTDWDSQTSLKIIQEMQDFKNHDAGVAPGLAVPEGGSDLESVRNNWAERQSKILLNGFDKKVENAINDTLNSYVNSFASHETSEPSTPTSEVRSSASIDPEGNHTLSPALTSAEPAKKPRNFIKFPRPNVLKYEVSNNSSFNLIANPGDTQLNFSQAYNEHTKLGIEHKTASQQTQMFINYEW